MYNFMDYCKNQETAFTLKGTLLILVGFNVLAQWKISATIAFITSMIAKSFENILMIGNVYKLKYNLPPFF